MATKRDQIIQATCDLLEAQGYHATGLQEIVDESGAPKGSLYYYFPDGKDEMAERAIRRTGRVISERIERHLSQEQDPGKAIASFIRELAERVEGSGFQSGSPLTSVAMETAVKNERLNHACRKAYRQISLAFCAKLEESGFSARRAEHMADLITSAIEGGIILSRTYHSGDPLRRVAAELQSLLAEEGEV